MPVSVVIVTHMDTGKALIEAARSVLDGNLPLTATTFSVPLNCDLNAATRDLRRTCDEIDHGDGVLILTDLYGSTPCNLSVGCRRDDAVHVVSGINLPMLIKIMNYPTLDLAALTEKALEGGHNGVVECCR